MPHSQTWCLYHIVFATKDRQALIPKEVLPRLWAYIGGIVRSEKMTAFAVGGTENHIHILLSVPPTLSLAKALQILKACSSKWMNEVIFQRHQFQWQEGYWGFTIGISQLDTTREYIDGQEAHHRRRNFSQELQAFLKRHGLGTNLTAS